MDDRVVTSEKCLHWYREEDTGDDGRQSPILANLSQSGSGELKRLVFVFLLSFFWFTREEAFLLTPVRWVLHLSCQPSNGNS